METVWEHREAAPGLPRSDKSKCQKGLCLAAAVMLFMLAGLHLCNESHTEGGVQLV